MQWKFEELRKEPLLHFFIIALILFIAAEFLNKDNRFNQEYTLLINEDKIIEHLQFQKKTFNQTFARRYWQSLTQTEKFNLIDDYIREEILYREAINLGLQEHDQIIRRRLIQKLDYVTGGFSSKISITDEDLKNYFQLNQEKYRIEASITFTHVFFDARHYSKENLEETAKQTLDQLLKQSIPFEKSSLYGDRFLFHRNYVERTSQLVASHLGNTLAQNVFRLPLNTWSGPLESPYGLHLILVSDHKKSRLPSLSEAYPLILEDYRREKLEVNKKMKFKELLAEYRVEWDNSLPYVPMDTIYAK
ncbi:peptidyl-prolyl cis-trans isomerase [Microbulbifer sp. VAAC004]|uniref:peptidyl-prolyl cis-trans isomerase n=1 Tax=unclassified Microbulbifer TaxID=2619833 RepID=UPI00403A0296